MSKHRIEFLIEMLKIADRQVKDSQAKAKELEKEVKALRDKISYLEPQIFGGSTK